MECMVHRQVTLGNLFEGLKVFIKNTTHTQIYQNNRLKIYFSYAVFFLSFFRSSYIHTPPSSSSTAL